MWTNKDNIFIGECDNCSSEDIEVRNYKGNDKQQTANLCEVCSSTFLSHALFYPSQCTNMHLFRSLALCTNIILRAIRDKK